jgi:hypothetical protein
LTVDTGSIQIQTQVQTRDLPVKQGNIVELDTSKCSPIIILIR